MNSLPINQIIQGDCLEVMQDFSDNSFDLILCDLPYSVTLCEWDTIIPFELLWEQYKRIIKNTGAIVLTAIQPFTSKLIMSNPKMFRYEWIWQKPQGVDPFMSKHRPLNNIEDVCVFGNAKIYNPQKESSKPYFIIRDKNPRLLETKNVVMKETQTLNFGERFPTRVLTFNQETGYHPTQKPVSLFSYLILTYTNENDLVLDNCIGSGTTAVAAINTNRRFIGIEKEEKYVDIANKRIKEFKQQIRLFEG